MPERKIFSLAEARELLPTVKTVTADAVHEAEALAGALQAIMGENGDPDPEHDEERERLGAQLNEVVARWAGRIQDMGLEAKGLWLVDFDNGQGYYCWRYPEAAVVHFHGYEEGFAGRMKIV